VAFGELLGDGREVIFDLLANRQHELSVETVLKGTSPGKVYADDGKNPETFFIRTPECNMIGGKSTNQAFNDWMRTTIGYYDSIVCDTEEWASVIRDIHPNCALKAFTRKYYRHSGGEAASAQPGSARVERVRRAGLGDIRYGNKEIVLDWLGGAAGEDAPDLAVAALVVVDGEIASCSAVDCVAGDRAEIGIKTVPVYRRRGYAALAVSEMVRSLSNEGIRDIGWHCMATNIGSRKTALRCGFVETCSYQAFFPFPPIENDTDITEDGWLGLGEYYKGKASVAMDQYWQAARCFAHSRCGEQVLLCVEGLVAGKQNWFIDCLDECPEFGFLSEDARWNRLLARVPQGR
jgi:GNAT superfamily N-acetyltransferase